MKKLVHSSSLPRDVCALTRCYNFDRELCDVGTRSSVVGSRENLGSSAVPFIVVTYFGRLGCGRMRTCGRCLASILDPVILGVMDVTVCVYARLMASQRASICSTA